MTEEDNLILFEDHYEKEVAELKIRLQTAENCLREIKAQLNKTGGKND